MYESRESRTRVEKLVDQLVRLANDESSRETLGVEGVLADQLDVSFLEDPIDYIAYDLTVALVAADDSDQPSPEVPPLLGMLVGEVRLCQVLQGSLDETELVRRTLQYLAEAG